MAVNNTLVARKVEEPSTTFMANGKEVKLSTSIVKQYLVSGDPNAVTLAEVEMFINLCKFNGLNPWIREAYLIKYSPSLPATLVVGKEAYMKRAETNEHFDGCEAGVIILTTNGEITYRLGTVVLDGEVIVGGWAEVYRKDRSHSTRSEVSFREYAGFTKEGKLNRQWSGKPATMIRKVALVQALREAFPSTYGAMYTAEEQGFSEDETAIQNLPQQAEEPKAQPMPDPSDDLPL